MTALSRKITLSDLRSARENGDKIAMLTCYDYTSARLMQEAGVPLLLVGDSAGNVVLGYDSTIPVSLDFMIEITAAVRRGAPLAMLVADMPFGSYHQDVAQGVRNVCRMMQLSGCDCVKLEVAESHLALVRALADAGVAVMAHLGLRPQSIAVLGGYRAQGRTAAAAAAIVEMAERAEQAGAAAILLEAVPPEVSERVVQRTSLPVIGCGAGPACHGSVVVMHDMLGLTPKAPKFVPLLGNVAQTLMGLFGEYVEQVASGDYPSPEHIYPMPPEEKAKFASLSNQER